MVFAVIHRKHRVTKDIADNVMLDILLYVDPMHLKGGAEIFCDALEKWENRPVGAVWNNNLSGLTS